MPATRQNNPTENRAASAVDQVLSDLLAQQTRPGLEALAQSLVHALANQEGLGAVAFSVHPDLASLLDPQWRHTQVRTLVRMVDEQAGRWVDQGDSWRDEPTQAGVERGDGPWPPNTPFPGEGGEWAVIRVQVRGQVALKLTLTFRNTLENHPDWDLEMKRLHHVLQVVGNLWLDNTGLGNELRQAANEKHALSRLNRLQGRFVGMATHEFKTPLTSITAYTDALLGQVEQMNFPAAEEFLGVIKVEAGRLLRMVNRILDFSRLEYGASMLGNSAHDLKPLIEETALTLRPTMAGKQQTFSLECVGTVPRAMVDADLLRQVMVNLIGNAAKYTPEGGAIKVILSEAESTVQVQVVDTGPGIPAQDVHRVFREFFRSQTMAARHEGTGLGLTIVRHIINLHGGWVEAARGAQGGSVFTFRVPKEVLELGTLPVRFTAVVDETKARGVITAVLRLVSEMLGAKAVTLWLPGPDGQEVPVAGLGLSLEDRAGRQPNLEASLVAADVELGRLRVGCLASGAAPSLGKQEQLEVMAELAAQAILVLIPGGHQGGEQSVTSQVDKVVEALGTLVRVSHNGLPTATVEALHLLDRLAARLGLTDRESRELKYAAALHDAGMARIEDEILLGDSELSFDERDEVDRHVEQGMDLMKALVPSVRVAELIRRHHERFDGSGYPGGLRGEEIPRGSRILAVVDAWVSLTSGRSYRPGLLPREALAEIQVNSGTQFDPQVVDSLASILVEEEHFDPDPQRPDPRVPVQKETT